jgi:hypothetical protein
MVNWNCCSSQSAYSTPPSSPNPAAQLVSSSQSASKEDWSWPISFPSRKRYWWSKETPLIIIDRKSLNDNNKLSNIIVECVTAVNDFSNSLLFKDLILHLFMKMAEEYHLYLDNAQLGYYRQQLYQNITKRLTIRLSGAVDSDNEPEDFHLISSIQDFVIKGNHEVRQ